MVCAGGAHWDVVARADRPLPSGADVPGTVERRPGGVALNVARGLARRGRPVRLAAAVGADADGADLVRTLVTEGIDDALVIRHGRTDRYVAIEGPDGGLHAAVMDDATLAARSRAVLAAALDQSPETLFVDANLATDALAGAATRLGAVPELILNPTSPAKADRLIPVVRAHPAPTVVLNRAEHDILAPHLGEAGTLLITDGAGPAVLRVDGRTIRADPRPVAAGPGSSRAGSVTGAGDALIAGFLAAHRPGADPHALLSAALDAAAHHLENP